MTLDVDPKHLVVEWPQKGGTRWLVEVTGADGSVTPICRLALAKLAPDLLKVVREIDAQAIRAGRENRGYHVVPSDSIRMLRSLMHRIGGIE